MEQIVGAILAIVIFTIPACIILNKKNRGAGYYVLAVLFPLIGLIVALCLGKIDPEEANATPPSFDITENGTDKNVN